MPYAVLTPDKTAVARVLAELPESFRPGFVLPVVEDSEPGFNPATHKAVRVWIIEAAQVRRGWQVVALSAAELAEVAAKADREQIKAIVADLQNGTGTTAVRLTRCERVLVRLILDMR